MWERERTTLLLAFGNVFHPLTPFPFEVEGNEKRGHKDKAAVWIPLLLLMQNALETLLCFPIDFVYYQVGWQTHENYGPSLNDKRDGRAGIKIMKW